MTVGFSDGTSYEDMRDYYLGQPHNSHQAPDRTADDEVDPFGNKIKGKTQDRVPQTPPDKQSSLTDTGESYDESSSRVIRHPGSATEPSGASNLDTSHHVPLIATALTKDGRSMYGMAVDHRVNLAMNFEGKDHDITPFLYAHEAAELPVMSDLVKGGMSNTDAYEQAHDKVANPTEAAARFAYAAKNHLDPEEFNKAYWSHIQQQAKVAQEPSDRDKHPDAHTTKYGLDKHYT